MYKYQFLILLFLLPGCKLNLERLSIQQLPFQSDMLRIDGYYYRCTESSCSTFILYANGVYKYSSYSAENKSLPEIDALVLDSTFNMYSKKIPYDWGLFEVVDSIIAIERWTWDPGGGPSGNYPKQVLKGIILNTQTIQVINSMGPNTSEDARRTFQFRPLIIKPDSINPFTPMMQDSSILNR